MSGDTLHTKALHLLQKSRQAFRLYSRAETAGGKTVSLPANLESIIESSTLQEIQKQAWRNVNAELIRTLGRILDASSPKQLPIELHQVRESFLIRFRESQSLLRQGHDELLAASERGDFLAVPKIGVSLISLKALGQAQQAALHELESLLTGNKNVPGDSRRSELSSKQQLLGKVIPLRRARG